ncbi:MAG: hypothetical protein K8U57_31365 [Planctomycetes bacterium]|nr:hypothetical protein [Planctomycetota bacterium]
MASTSGAEPSELITRAMLVAAEAMFVQGFANLTTALIANTAATIANTAASKVGGVGVGGGGSAAAAVGSTLYYQTQSIILSQKQHKTLEDILWQVSAIRAKGTGEQQNTGGSPKDKDDKKEKEKPSAFATIGNALTGKLLGALGPITSLAQIIGSSASGFQVFTAAMNVVAATLAPIVLPVFLAMAGAALDFADVLQTKLAPGMKQFIGLVFDGLIPVLAKLIEYFFRLTDGLADIMLAVANFTSEIPNLARDLRNAVLGPVATDEERADSIREARKAGTSDEVIRIGGAFTGVKPADLARAFDLAGREAGRKADLTGGEFKVIGTGGGRAGGRGIDDAISSFLQSIGPKAQFSGLADVGKSAQLAALNGDAIQQRMLEALVRSGHDIAAIRESLAGGPPPAGPPSVHRGAAEID